MSYSGDSFSAGEQPTTSKWNKLWSNDASFNDGTGIGTNAIAAASLASNAIRLGVGSITSTFLGSSTNTYIDVTGVSLTVTIPAGSRSLVLLFDSQYVATTAAGGTGVFISINEGATVLKEKIVNTPSPNYALNLMTAAYIAAPTAGSHTYKVQVKSDAASNVSVAATATAPAYLLAVLV